MFKNCDTTTQVLPCGFQSLLAALNFDTDLAVILNQVTIVTQNLNVVSPANSSIILTQLRETLRSVQYTLLAKYGCNRLQRSDNQMLKTVRLGLLLYAGILQNDFWISPLGSQLKRQVELCVQGKDRPVTGLMGALRLWVVFLAGPLVLDSSKRSLFVRFIARAREERALTSWEDGRDVLTTFAWVGKIQDASGQALWEESVRWQPYCSSVSR